MAGWHSLSGYLFFKPGGALGKLKSRKRQWYLFEESNCQLLYYKSQDEAKTRQQPLGSIDIKGAAITLSSDQSNQFCIISYGKEYNLVAENHESLMIWLIALQKASDAWLGKRDAHANRSAGECIRSKSLREKVENNLQRFRSESDTGLFRRRSTLVMEKYRRSSMQFGRLDPNKQKRLQKRLGESFEAELEMYKSHDLEFSNLESKQHLSKSLENTHIISPRLQLARRGVGSGGGGEHESSSNESADDVFMAEEILMCGAHLSSDEKLRLLRRMQSDVDRLHITSTGGATTAQRPSSLSGASAGSSDSAIEKESELCSRLADMEQDLMSTKCELAKALNHETCYKQILARRDTVILDLDEKLEKLEMSVKPGDKSNDKKMKEQIRVLQNENRFLNEEVRKLANIRQTEQEKYQKQIEMIQNLESEIEQWKRDYLFLLQSSVTVPTGDLMDGMEVNLYGGNKHKERIQELLEEARVTNPYLPTYDKLAKSEVHIDCYGFKHSYGNEGLLLHYICQQLNQHYSVLVSDYERHQQQWKELLTQNRNNIQPSKELRLLCRGGIPPQFRVEVWRQLIYNQVRDVAEEKGSHYYGHLCSTAADSQFAGRYKKQISLDLLRTMPNNIHFCVRDAAGIEKMQEVLLAVCIHNNNVGYCQGMNFIVGMCLLFLEAEDAFWALVAITEKYFNPNYFDTNLSGAQADQEVLKVLVQDKLPNLHKHLDNLDIEISTVTLNWFLAVFFDAVPFETLIRIWDCFLCEGPKVLFRFALAILKIHEKSILEKTDTIGIMRHLKSCARLTYDVEGLIKTAFEDLHPFPRRQDIAAKQTVYLNTLKEKLRRKTLQRRAHMEREQMFRELDLTPSSAMVIECAATYEEGHVWLCAGKQNQGQIYWINCEDSRMTHLDLKVDSRIMCSVAMTSNIMLLGTLSWNVHAFNITTREELWSIHLHDTVLSLAVLMEGRHKKVFAALADGTLAIIDDASDQEPREDPFYIPIGRSPVTTVTVISQNLWCACGNTVSILHAGTLDPMDNFTVSINPFDHILTMSYNHYGLWIAVKGSSVIELWDPVLLTCKMLYDVKENKYPNLRRDEESFLNMARITSILPFETSIWVGTGDGNLVLFDVIDRSSGKHTSREQSSASNSSSPYHVKDLLSSLASIDKVEEKIHELYFKRLNDHYTSVTGKSGLDEPMFPVSDDIHDNTPEEEECHSGDEKSSLSFDTVKHVSPCDSRCQSVEVDMDAVDVKVQTAKTESVDLDEKERLKNVDTLNGDSANECRKTDNKNECQSSIMITDPQGVENVILDATSPVKDEIKQKLSQSQILKQDDKTALEELDPIIECSENGQTHEDGHDTIASDMPSADVKQKNKANLKCVRRNSAPPFPKSPRVPRKTVKDSQTSNKQVSNKRPRERCRSTSPVLESIKEQYEKTSSCTSSPKRHLVKQAEVDIDSSDSQQEGSNKESRSRYRDINNDLDVKSRQGHIDQDKEQILQQRHRNNGKERSGDAKKDRKSTSHQKVGSEIEARMGEADVDSKKGFQSSHPKSEKCKTDNDVSNNLDKSEKKSNLTNKKHKFSKSDENLGRKSNAECTIKTEDKTNASDKSALSELRVNVDEGIHELFPLSPISEKTESSQSLNVITDQDDDGTAHQREPASANLLTAEKKDEDIMGSFTNITLAEAELITRKALVLGQLPPNLYPPVGSDTVTTTRCSSYENISSVSQKDYESQVDSSKEERKAKYRHLKPSHCRSTSSMSVGSMNEMPYICELSLQAKIKIADKPIRCLLKTSCNGEAVIISCAGCHGDDEAVLKWKKEANEKLWTNEPVLELCPVTKATRRPSYMRNQLVSMDSTRSSFDSLDSPVSPKPLSLPLFSKQKNEEGNNF